MMANLHIEKNTIVRVQIILKPDVLDNLIQDHPECTTITIFHIDLYDTGSEFMTKFRVGRRHWAEVFKAYLGEYTRALIIEAIKP